MRNQIPFKIVLAVFGFLAGFAITAGLIRLDAHRAVAAETLVVLKVVPPGHSI